MLIFSIQSKCGIIILTLTVLENKLKSINSSDIFNLLLYLKENHMNSTCLKVELHRTTDRRPGASPSIAKNCQGLVHSFITSK